MENSLVTVPAAPGRSRAFGQERHWILPGGHTDQYGAIISLPYVWGETLDIPLNTQRSIIVVRMPSPGTLLPVVGNPLKLRVDKVYIRLYEGQEAHPLTLTTATSGSSTVPAFTSNLNVVGSMNTSMSGSLQTAQSVGHNATVTSTGNFVPAATTTVPQTGSLVGTFNVGETLGALFTNTIAGGTNVTFTIPAFNVTFPQYQFPTALIGNVGVLNTTGSGSGFLLVSAGSTNPFMQDVCPGWVTSDSTSGSLYDPANVCLNQIAIALYVGVMNTAGTSIGVKNPAATGDATYDYLDLKTDVYLLPWGSVRQYTGREWVLNLPFPVELGMGECLMLSISNTTNCVSSMNLVAYVRSLVCAVD
jgi:hypothetical protein